MGCARAVCQQRTDHVREWDVPVLFASWRKKAKKINAYPTQSINQSMIDDHRKEIFLALDVSCIKE
jgi:hypothetical protein